MRRNKRRKESVRPSHITAPSPIMSAVTGTHLLRGPRKSPLFFPLYSPSPFSLILSSFPSLSSLLLPFSLKFVFSFPHLFLSPVFSSSHFSVPTLFSFPHPSLSFLFSVFPFLSLLLLLSFSFLTFLLLSSFHLLSLLRPHLPLPSLFSFFLFSSSPIFFFPFLSPSFLFPLLSFLTLLPLNLCSFLFPLPLLFHPGFQTSPFSSSSLLPLFFPLPILLLSFLANPLSPNQFPPLFLLYRIFLLFVSF